MILKGQTSRDTKTQLEAVEEPKGIFWAKCLTHGTKEQAASKSDAINALKRPRGWCLACRALPPKVTSP